MSNKFQPENEMKNMMDKSSVYKLYKKTV